jgi:hypothetical protein
LLYLTGRRLVDRWVGLASAVLGALSPMYLWYGQEARMYAMLAFCSLLSVYALVRAFWDSSELQTSPRQWRWIVAFILASACLMLTHYLGLLLVAFELLALGLLLVRKRGRRPAVIVTTGVILGLSLALLAYALVTLPRATNRSGFRFIPLPDLLRDLLNSFSLGLSVDISLWYVLLIDLAFLLLLIVGFVRLVRPGAPANWRSAGWLLAGYLLVPTALIYLLSYVQPAYMNSRHLILVTPAFYLLVAAGLTSLRGRSFWIALLAWIVVVGGVGYSTYNYFCNPTYDKDNHREWGAYLREHVRPGDVVVVDPPHIADLYEYYGDSGAPWIGLPLLGASWQDTATVLEDLVRRYDRVWLALSLTPPWGDRRRFPEKWLNQNAFRVDYKGFESYASTVFVAAYLPEWPDLERLPEGSRPVKVRYTPSLRLEGYRIVSPPQPGVQLHIELFWAVDQPIPEEASVVLRLTDEEGHLWGQGEQCPFNGLYPMWQWQPGLLLRDEHELRIEPGTPPGTYRLEVMLVSRPTEEGCFGPSGQPIIFQTAPPQANLGDRVLLGTVDVQHTPGGAGFDDQEIEYHERAGFDGLELLGASLPSSVMRPGQRLGVTLYWQAQAAPLPDARFRLRLKDPAGDIQQEATIRPTGGDHPTDRWQEGDRFKGKFSLLLPEEAPGGRYSLELLPEPPLRQTGMGAALARLLRPEADALTLANIEVESRSEGEPAAPATPIPIPTDLAIAQPMLATLGDQVRFLGYDLDVDAVQAGGTLSFTLYWQALRPMDTSYSVFTHLLGPSSQIIGQRDGVPQGGNYPTTLWQPGEVVVDPYAFAVDPAAPPGEYPLEVGMYRLETGTRLSLVDADGQPIPDDRVLLPRITVLPGVTPEVVAPEMPNRVYLPLVERGQ